MSSASTSSDTAKPFEPTFSRQRELPPLPVPDLNQTLDRYLKSATVLATPEAAEKTRKAVEDFRQSAYAKQLQEALVNRAKEKKNWVEDWWYDLYTEYREPLAPAQSVCGTCSLYKPNAGRQLHAAAESAHHWMRYWKLIRDEKLPITKSRGVIWDMYQYHCLFNSNRTPALPRDRMDRYFKTAAEGNCPSHVAVMCRGNIWKVEMMRAGELKSIDEIYQTLSYIKRNSHWQPHSIATLTCQNRGAWAKDREALVRYSHKNEEHLAIIEQAVFVLSLGEGSPSTDKELLERAMLDESATYWQDKSVNIAFFDNGMTTFQADHSNVDAIVVIHIADMVGRDMRQELWTAADVCFDMPQLLDFDLAPVHKESVDKAERYFLSKKHKHRVDVIRYHGYGNDILKKKKIYIDTIAQLALQLSFYKTHGYFAPIYETASTRKFFHGRTETIRGRTKEIVEFGKAVLENRSIEEQRKLFEAAYNAHNILMAEAMEANGFDRHLYGLQKTMALFTKGCSPKRPVPEMFTDPAWTASGGNGNFLLSTSFCGYIPEVEDEGYGYVCAMRPDGYGTFYRTAGNRFLFVITDFVDTKSNLGEYGNNIKWALDRLGEIVGVNSAKI